MVFGASALILAGCTSDVNQEITNAYVEKANNVVIQYTYESFDTNLSSQFDITPDFTLYGDGRLIFGEPLVFPMYYMPGLPGVPPFVYQPAYQLNEIQLTKEEVVEFIDYLNERDFMKLSKSWYDGSSSNGKHIVTMNLCCGSNTIEIYGESMSTELREIVDHLREYMDLSGRASIYAFQEMGITCEEVNYLLAYVPNWSFPTIDLDNLAGSVKGKELEGQLKVDVLDALTTQSRFFMYNGKTYVIYYKPLLPY